MSLLLQWSGELAGCAENETRNPAHGMLVHLDDSLLRRHGPARVSLPDVTHRRNVIFHKAPGTFHGGTIGGRYPTLADRLVQTHRAHGRAGGLERAAGLIEKQVQPAAAILNTRHAAGQGIQITNQFGKVGVLGR